MTTKKGKTTGAAQRPKETKPKPKRKRPPYISFNKAETAALAGVCLRSLRVYFELKWLANFRTGMVGTFKDQKLTYEKIATRVAIPTSQGRSTASNTIDGKEVARIIQRLELAGLVEDIQNSQYGLTLRLPMSPMPDLEAPDEEIEQEPNEPQEQVTASTDPVWARPEPIRAPAPQPKPEPTQASDDDEDDWDKDLPESATSPATSTQTDGNQAQKLPTDPVPEMVANPHGYRGFSTSDPSLSVLINTEGQYSFSVHEAQAPASARSALANVGSAGALTEPLGETRRLTAAPFRGRNPNLDAGQIRERIRALYPQFSYLDTQVSATFFQRVEGLSITVSELDEAARSLVDDPTQKLTAGALFDCLVARRRRPRRLPGGVVL